MHPRQVAGCFARFIGRFTAARALCAFPYAPPVTAFSALRFRPAFVVGIPVARATARFTFVMPNAVFIEGFRYRNSFISILFSKQNKSSYLLQDKSFLWWSVLDSNQALAHPAKLKTRELRQKAHRIHSHSGALFQFLFSKWVLEWVIYSPVFSHPGGIMHLNYCISRSTRVY